MGGQGFFSTRWDNKGVDAITVREREGQKLLEFYICCILRVIKEQWFKAREFSYLENGRSLISGSASEDHILHTGCVIPPPSYTSPSHDASETSSYPSFMRMGKSAIL